jgi:polysaccharide pyruvyl transferase WcaK-like protein
MTSVLIVGDIGLGDGHFHVGDEAMFAAAKEELERRGVDSIVAISSTPANTTERYGVPAIGRLDFSHVRTPRQSDKEDRLDRIVRSALGETGLLDWLDPAWTVIGQVADADAVLVSGGGNLSSSWSEHIYERAALARLSQIFSKLFILTGQTLGPALTQTDGELVAEILATAALVGVREEHSELVARALGDFPHLVRTIDDAAFFGDEVSIPDSLESDRYCVATFASYTGSAPPEDFVRRIAQFLDDAIDETDLDVVLISHESSPDPAVVDGDRAIHQRIIATMGSTRVSELGIQDPRSVAAITRGAAISVSTRYHPAVFAVSGAVPTVTFSTDEYTDVKLSGALANFGLTDGALSSVALATDDARDTFARVWKDREAIRTHLASVGASRRAWAGEWWDAVAAVVRGDEASVPEWRGAPERRILAPRLRERNSRLRAWVRDEGRARVGAEIARRASLDDLNALHAEIRSVENALGEARADLEVAVQRAAEAEAALEAGQLMLAQVTDPIYERTLRTHPSVVRAEELQALLDSRTFRWTSRPRAAYGRVRRMLGR